jgi:hypothetical protein
MHAGRVPGTMRPIMSSSILLRASAALALASALAGCDSSSSSSGDTPAKAPKAAPSAQPANGAPVAIEVTKLTAGAKFEGKLALDAYNFSDKKVAAYGLVARFFDKDGAPIKVGVGTPFEDEVAWTSMSGKKFACEPKSWCSFEMEGIEVPANATKAEAAITSVRALAADGLNFEEPDLWKSPEGMGKWPAGLK